MPSEGVEMVDSCMGNSKDYMPSAASPTFHQTQVFGRLIELFILEDAKGQTARFKLPCEGLAGWHAIVEPVWICSSMPKLISLVQLYKPHQSAMLTCSLQGGGE